MEIPFPRFSFSGDHAPTPPQMVLSCAFGTQISSQILHWPVRAQIISGYSTANQDQFQKWLGVELANLGI